MHEDKRLAVLKKVYELQDKGLTTAAKAQQLSYEEALAKQAEVKAYDESMKATSNEEILTALANDESFKGIDIENLRQKVEDALLPQISSAETADLYADAEKNLAAITDRMKKDFSSGFVDEFMDDIQDMKKELQAAGTFTEEEFVAKIKKMYNFSNVNDESMKAYEEYFHDIFKALSAGEGRLKSYKAAIDSILKRKRLCKA